MTGTPRYSDMHPRFRFAGADTSTGQGKDWQRTDVRSAKRRLSDGTSIGIGGPPAGCT